MCRTCDIQSIINDDTNTEKNMLCLYLNFIESCWQKKRLLTSDHVRWPCDGLVTNVWWVSENIESCSSRKVAVITNLTKLDWSGSIMDRNVSIFAIDSNLVGRSRNWHGLKSQKTKIWGIPVVGIGAHITICEFQVSPSVTVAWAGRQSCRNAFGGGVT